MVMRRRAMRTAGLVCAAALSLIGGPAAGVARPVASLPNLVALPSPDLYVGTATSHYVNSNSQVVWGCQPSEVGGDTPTPTRCLRFETLVANLGTGPLELRYRADQITSTRGVMQRIYASDGSYREFPAGSYVLHPAHAHFHFVDFAVAALWQADAGGRRRGAAPLRSGRKAGFCLEDVYQYRGSTEARYVPPYACYPNRAVGGEVSQVNGISVGWADVYDLATPGQYIEISGVPDGYYLLQITVDPDRRLREQRTADNVVWQRIRLCGDKAEVIGRATACPNSSAARP